MREFLGDQELNLEQATSIARAMLKVAAEEKGVHEKEREMIDAFYQACAEAAGAAPDDLDAHPWNADEARRVLDTPELKDVMLRSCYLLGYADGHLSPPEKALIEQLSRELGVSDDRRTQVDREVKRTLLSQFEDISIFREATYDIGRQLGMSPQEVDEVLAHHS